MVTERPEDELTPYCALMREVRGHGYRRQELLGEDLDWAYLFTVRLQVSAGAVGQDIVRYRDRSNLFTGRHAPNSLPTRLETLLVPTGLALETLAKPIHVHEALDWKCANDW